MSEPAELVLYTASYHRRLGWQVIGPDGKPLPEVFNSASHAGGVAGQMNKAARRDAGRTKRKCLCCRKEFMSEGSHNRMCDPCRRLGTEIQSPYGVAPIRRGRS